MYWGVFIIWWLCGEGAGFEVMTFVNLCAVILSERIIMLKIQDCFFLSFFSFKISFSRNFTLSLMLGINSNCITQEFTKSASSWVVYHFIYKSPKPLAPCYSVFCWYLGQCMRFLNLTMLYSVHLFTILVVIGDYTITATEVYCNQEIDKFTPCICITMVTFDNTRMYVTIATLEPMNQETRAITLHLLTQCYIILLCILNNPCVYFLLITFISLDH